MRIEARYPCPVCLGVKLEKITLRTDTAAHAGAGAAAAPLPVAAPPAADWDLILDHCARCGGVWFEAGEVQRLRRCEAELLWREIVRREDPHVMLCHMCRSPVDRQADACGVCGWKVRLACPTCARPLHVAEHDGMRLDSCRRCRGVWFDHAELAGIWRLELQGALARRRAAAAAGGVSDGSVLLLDALLFDPFVLYYGLHAGAHVAGAAAEGMLGAGGAAGEGLAQVAGGSAEAIGEIAGAAGEAAASVFETIVEIIGGIFG